jgi:hypothetical protein
MRHFTVRNALVHAAVSLAVVLVAASISYYSRALSFFTQLTESLPNHAFVDATLVGHYYDGDRLTANRNLTLKADGTFYCTWTGCLGDYGSTQGNWGRVGNTVHLVATELDGMFKQKPLGNLIVSDNDEGLRLFRFNGYAFDSSDGTQHFPSPAPNAPGNHRLQRSP